MHAHDKEGTGGQGRWAIEMQIEQKKLAYFMLTNYATYCSRETCNKFSMIFGSGNEWPT